MPVRKGSKALPHSGNARAADMDRRATNEFIQSRLNSTSRRAELDRVHGREAVDENVRQLRSEGENSRKNAARARSKKYAKGGSVSSASKRADGCAIKGKTKGKFV